MAILVLAIAFLVELAGFTAFGVAAGQVVGPIAGVVAAFGVIAVWALVVAPKARNPLTQPQRDRIGTAILLLASVALAVAGLPIAGTVLAVVVILEVVALRVIGPDARDAFATSVGHA
jgi:hypothetical protein